MKKLIKMASFFMCCFIFTCIFSACREKNEDEKVNTHFTQTYTSDMDFINDVKAYGISNSNINNMKANESIKAFFDCDDIDGFNQRLYDNVSATTMFALYKSFESNLGAIYRIAIKVGTHYEPFLVHCSVLNKNDIANAIKVRLKNPESLQLHSAKVYWTTKNVQEQKCFHATDIDFYADYSAQNGFGGLNRTYCSVSFSFYTSEFSYSGNTLSAYNYATAIAKCDYNKSIY